MDTRFSNTAIRIAAFGGAVGWLTLAVGFQASHTLEQGRDWDGLPQALYFVGAAGLLIGGLAFGVMALNRAESVDRPRLRVVGLTLLAIGLVLSLIAGWAVPVWAVVYGLAMLTLVRSGVLEGEGWIIGGAMSVAALAFFSLTELGVGTPDVYGDYPVAWNAATWIAGLGSAVGLVAWSVTSLDEPVDERVTSTA